MCMFCRSLFVLLYFFLWPLCCLFFFDLRILITPLVSSNSSSIKLTYKNVFNEVKIIYCYKKENQAYLFSICINYRCPDICFLLSVQFGWRNMMFSPWPCVDYFLRHNDRIIISYNCSYYSIVRYKTEIK